MSDRQRMKQGPKLGGLRRALMAGLAVAVSFSSLLDTASAADKFRLPNTFEKSGGGSYSDLPGVRPMPPGGFSSDSGYDCHTTTRFVDRGRDSPLRSGDGVPVVIYRCSKDGMIFEGRNPPSKGWYPGVNPRNID